MPNKIVLIACAPISENIPCFATPIYKNGSSYCIVDGNNDTLKLTEINIDEARKHTFIQDIKCNRTLNTTLPLTQRLYTYYINNKSILVGNEKQIKQQILENIEQILTLGGSIETLSSFVGELKLVNKIKLVLLNKNREIRQLKSELENNDFSHKNIMTDFFTEAPSKLTGHELTCFVSGRIRQDRVPNRQTHDARRVALQNYIHGQQNLRVVIMQDNKSNKQRKSQRMLSKRRNLANIDREQDVFEPQK